MKHGERMLVAEHIRKIAASGKSKRKLELIAKGLHHEHNWVRHTAGKALAGFGSEGLRKIAAQIDNPNHEIAWDAIDSLQQAGFRTPETLPEILPKLIQILKENPHDFKAAQIVADYADSRYLGQLSRLPKNETITDAIKAINDKERAKNLIRTNDNEEIEKVLRNKSSILGHPGTHANFFRALARHGTPKQLPLLEAIDKEREADYVGGWHSLLHFAIEGIKKRSASGEKT